MSRRRIAVAVACLGPVLGLVALAMLPSTAAEAGFRLRVGGPVGIVRSTMGRILSLAGARHARMHVRASRARTAALQTQDLRGAVDPARPLSSPALRSQLTAVAALAGWHGGRGEARGQAGWWRHADGGYGWIGPLFWPFADDDLADAIIWDQGSAFWAYGYADIHAAVFAPYGASELVSYASRRRTRIPPLDRFCGSDERDGAGLPVERMTQAVQPNEAQRAALDEFATAWRSASQIVRIHCQQQPAASGLERLAVMQNRIEAMIEATAVIAPQLVKLDQLLDPDQKQRLAALAGGTQATPVASRPRQVATAACQAAPPASPRDERKAQEFLARQWPVAQISASLHLGDVQSAALEVVQGTATRFLDPLEAACPLQPPATMPARLEAVQARLKAMLQSIKDVSAALDDFNYNLTDEQKAQFEAWGPKRGT